MNKTTIFVCLDGCGPEYIEQSDTPNIDKMAKNGFYWLGHSVIPSVTNVNNVSIVTGSPPSVHGITSNYYYDRQSKQGVFMESPDFLLTETMLQRAKKEGLSTAVLTTKDKLLRLLGQDVDTVISAESPPDWLLQTIGSPGHIYSAEINLWLFRALKVILKEKSPDVVYLATTDYMMHKYAPDTAASQAHINALDNLLGEVLDRYDVRMLLTADHGMLDKTVAVDLAQILREQGIIAEVIPIIKDRYVVHHGNLGGAAYIYLDEKDRDGAVKILRECKGVEEVWLQADAAEKFQLYKERIGDIFVLADRDSVFGEVGQTPLSAIRSHGSRYESEVPIISYGLKPPKQWKNNFEITQIDLS
jgi:phosphonoacetate hydrolase